MAARRRTGGGGTGGSGGRGARGRNAGSGGHGGSGARSGGGKPGAGSGRSGKPGAGGSGEKGASGRGQSGRAAGDRLAQRVKTAKGRSVSSTRWIERQLNDPYVQRAKADGYRSRAAYKLIEIDDRYRLLKPGQTVVDLGAAPGGWSQVAADRARAGVRTPVVAIDILPMDPVGGVTVLTHDFSAEDAPARLVEALGGRRADVVLSDLAPETTGHRATDHLRIVGLVELAYDFAISVLAPNGTFLAKVFQGGTEGELLAALRRDFKTVRHVKPPASRPESPETYMLATGFRGARSAPADSGTDGDDPAT